MVDAHGRVERVDTPGPGLLCFTIWDGHAKRVLGVVTIPAAFGLAVATERPVGASATELTTALRRTLQGGRLVRMEESTRALVLTFACGEDDVRLIAEPRTTTGRWALVEGADKVLITSDGRIRAGGTWTELIAAGEPRDPDSLLAGSPARWSAYREATIALTRQALGRVVRKRLSKARRTLDAVEQDLARTQQAQVLQHKATLLAAHLHEVVPGSTEISVRDWETPHTTVHIALDPTQPPATQVDAWFRKAKRLRRGAARATQRLAEVRPAVDALEALHAKIATASTVEELEALGKSLGTDPLLESQKARKTGRKRSQERLPFRVFRGHGDARVLVGRGAKDNDALTLRHARPSDLWLHARGLPGAHVVVPLTKGTDCPAELLIDAATLTAHFSEARGEPLVDIIYTPRRYVRKTKGSSVGVVHLEREKVLTLRLEPSRLKRLLANEDRA